MAAHPADASLEDELGLPREDTAANHIEQHDEDDAQQQCYGYASQRADPHCGWGAGGCWVGSQQGQGRMGGGGAVSMGGDMVELLLPPCRLARHTS